MMTKEVLSGRSAHDVGRNVLRLVLVVLCMLAAAVMLAGFPRAAVLVSCAGLLFAAWRVRFPVSDAMQRSREPAAGGAVQRGEPQQRDSAAVRAILANMREGLIALDSARCVVEMNPAALSLLGMEAGLPKWTSSAAELPFDQVVRHAGLRRFVEYVHREQRGCEEVLSVDAEGGERLLQVYGHPLRAEDGNARGLLIVISDVTQLHHLEKVRREFVANVSHELKTPVTSIKGFVETLLDGAIDDPESARRFLAIIQRQADRLNMIFEDLLSLSRIELERERGGIILERGALDEVLASVIETWEHAAAEKSIALDWQCPAGTFVNMNPRLLEQAIGNLIENALKYSDPGTRVTLSVEREADAVVVRVKDTGRGIEKVHLPRIFERFYRVDRARSRKEGGTGLGLAIVKHIAQAHGGYPSVESELGKGSTFSLHLPLAAATQEHQERSTG